MLKFKETFLLLTVFLCMQLATYEAQTDICNECVCETQDKKITCRHVSPDNLFIPTNSFYTRLDWRFCDIGTYRADTYTKFTALEVLDIRYVDIDCDSLPVTANFTILSDCVKITTTTTAAPATKSSSITTSDPTTTLITTPTTSTTVTKGTTSPDPALSVDITPGFAKIRRRVGSSLELECSVRGLPEDVIPDIKWFMNGDHVTDSSRVFTRSTSRVSQNLYVFDLGHADRGTYWCEASSGGRIARKHVSIVVFNDIVFNCAPLTQYPWSGTDALIQCQVSGDPAPTVFWRHKQNIIKPGGRYVYEPQGLRIYNIMHADSGLYMCVAEVAHEGRVKETLISVIVN